MTRRILYILAFIGCAALAAAYAVQRDIHGRYEAQRQHQQAVDAARQQVESLERELIQHKERLEGLDHDPVEIEASVRRVRHLVRPGETVYRIIEESAESLNDEAPQTPPTDRADAGFRTEHEVQQQH